MPKISTNGGCFCLLTLAYWDCRKRGGRRNLVAPKAQGDNTMYVHEAQTVPSRMVRIYTYAQSLVESRRLCAAFYIQAEQCLHIVGKRQTLEVTFDGVYDGFDTFRVEQYPLDATYIRSCTMSDCLVAIRNIAARG